MVKNKNLRLANMSIGSKLTILLLTVDGVIKPDSLASYKKLHCWSKKTNLVQLLHKYWSFLMQKTHSPMLTLIVVTHLYSCLCVKSLLSISTFLLSYRWIRISAQRFPTHFYHFHFLPSEELNLVSSTYIFVEKHGWQHSLVDKFTLAMLHVYKTNFIG
mgnify:CR=1 FL=1